jgi:adenylate cyclase
MNTRGRNRAERRLAAILAADVAGYSRLIGADEEGTLDRLRWIRAELIDPTITAHRGRLVKTTGDGLLVEFASVVDALRCATEVQQAMAGRNAGIAATERIEFRIGINMGDVVVEDGDIFGDGVNVAARLEGLAEPGGICLSARVQEDVAGRLDLVFDDLGEQALKNIARSIRVYRVRSESPVPTPGAPVPAGGHPGAPPQAGEGTARSARVGAAEPPAVPLPDKPSIAVLPFQNLSGDPEQEYFADGMVEEIITALSRIRWLFVIARNSSFTYKGQAVDVKQVGRELGVRYVLEGSVRKGGGRVRITAQLIDAETGAHLWADRFDGSLEDVFDLQDNVAFSVAGIIESTLQAAEIKRSTERPTSDPTAYDLYLHALPNCYSWHEERVRVALDLLEQAIRRDPQFGPALGLAAICHHHLAGFGGEKGPEAHRRAAVALARQALQASPSDPGAIANAAHVLGRFEADIKPAITLADRALALNPNFERGWRAGAWLRLWAGDPDGAVERIRTAMRLSPRFENATDFTLIGLAQLFDRRFEEAIATFLAVLDRLPKNPEIHRYLAACYAKIGRLDEAHQMVERLRTITPIIVPDHVQFRKPEHRELYLSGLRLAAGETT